MTSKVFVEYVIPGNSTGTLVYSFTKLGSSLVRNELGTVSRRILEEAFQLTGLTGTIANSLAIVREESFIGAEGE